ncbi:acetate--CoA ligase family protein [Halospeciosus flavus]|uniref:acetate--CoA ligase (ADP-forming) n=1 Tax=Halospeciosus flavus TaxID=3032283 RepID=A0ABD5Z3L7_9EURY|nr:acetate--CoA ligase [Halospeciosus flavus]
MGETDIDRILDPDSVAVVGASTDETKRGYQAIQTLQNSGYDGDIYPVNPNADEIRGLTVYPTVSSIPARVDLALIVTPAPIVPDVLEDCGDTDLAGAIVVAVGFSESGADGEALEEEIVSIARENDIRLIGPNTSGMINVHRGLNLVGADIVPEGNLALLCQSGNMAIGLFTEAADRDGAGFSHYVGVGNESDLHFDEYLPFFVDHDETDAVVLYVEGMEDGRAFLETTSQVTTDLPIIALKSGRTEAGKQSASSHTGSLAGDSRVADAVYRQAGIVTVDRSDELLPVSRALADLPAASGTNIGILADGGGHATLAADALVDRGLDVPRLGDATQTTLQNHLPDAASIVNPVDVAGGTDDDPSVFFDCAEAIAADPNVDALLLTGLFGGYGIRFADEYTDVETRTAERLATLVDEYDIPVVVQSAYEGFDTEAHEVLRAHGIPVLQSLEVATSCLDALSTYGTHLETADTKSDFTLDRDEPAPSESLTSALKAGHDTLSEYESKELLDQNGVTVTPYRLATSADEAVVAFEAFDEPVAMKVVSRDIVHKSEADGIALDVDSPTVARNQYHELLDAARSYDPEAELDGVLVSPMREDGIEVIVGTVDDQQFGPVEMFGLGGIFVEVLEDVGFRGLPLTEADARALVDDIEAQAMLDGARGDPAVSREALVELLVDVSDLVASNPAIAELDLNPVLAGPDGVEILDASITLESREEVAKRNLVATGGVDDE